ncbi:HD domain [Cardinium endosymbiont of Sogatella furcifera]|nr:HD domain [Cardinium endosymbiont of Sogatella furcifera]
MLLTTLFLMALPFVLLVLVVALYLTRTRVTSEEQRLDHAQFFNEVNALQQALTGKKSRINKTLQAAALQERFDKLRPSDAIIGCTGCYVILTTILDYISGGLTIYWYILQFFIGIWLIGYGIAPKQGIPSWKIGCSWLICTILCLPVNVFWHWFHLQDPQFALTLSVGHLSATLFVLPLYISIKLVFVTLLVIFYAIYNIGVDQLLASSDSLLSLLGFGLIVFSIIVYNKRKITAYTLYNRYLKGQVTSEKKNHRPPHSNLHPDMAAKTTKASGSFVEKAMQEVTELISYLDNRPLYKQDIQSIINNFFTFTTFLKQRAKSVDHLLLTPHEITIDELMARLTSALEAKTAPVPKLIVEIKDSTVSNKITCDINHILQALVPIVLRTANPSVAKGEFVKIQLHTTYLKYRQKHKQKDKNYSEMTFPAIAIVISRLHTPLTILPQIKGHYEDITEGRELKWHNNQKDIERIHIEKRIIERSIRAHYGYLRFPFSQKRPMLMVLPSNVATVRDAMITKILPINVPVTQQEVDQSMEVFMKSYNHLLEISEARKAVIDEILLLTRRCYGFRRHLSGQFLYIRAIGIAQLVAEWIRFYPEPIYVALLYDLTHYADLPLSYIKANYDLNIYSFIESVLAVNDRQGMEPCGLYIGNALKQVIIREQLFVLCIKLAERLYDLRHAKSYTHLDELKYMAQETLAIDIELAKKYLNTNIVEALANAAEQALQVCEQQ